MRPVFMDTGYVYALRNTNDPFHEAAVQWTELLRARPKVTTTAVLLELGDGFSDAFEWALFMDFLDSFQRTPGNEVVTVSPSVLAAAMALRAERDKPGPRRDLAKTEKLRRAPQLTDCISFVVMRQHKITEALTVDEHFRSEGFITPLLPPKR